MTRAEQLQLLRSGHFTIVYHDNGQCTLYKGKYEYGSLPEEGVADYRDYDGDGYLPPIVQLLVDALGGASETI